MIVLVPFVPCMMLRLLGDAERVKFPVGFTVSVIAGLVRQDCRTNPSNGYSDRANGGCAACSQRQCARARGAAGIERRRHAAWQTGYRQADVAREAIFRSDRDCARAAGSL